MKPEKWLPIKGYEGLYEISSHGRVKSLTKGGGSRKKAHETERILPPTKRGENGYLRVCLCKDRHRKYHKVHHLVLEAFVGPRPIGMLALHKDDDRYSNSTENLYWGTPKKNSSDRRKNGKYSLEHVAHGEGHGNAVVTTSQVLEIRRLHSVEKMGNYILDSSNRLATIR